MDRYKQAKQAEELKAEEPKAAETKTEDVKSKHQKTDTPAAAKSKPEVNKDVATAVAPKYEYKPEYKSPAARRSEVKSSVDAESPVSSRWARARDDSDARTTPKPAEQIKDKRKQDDRVPASHLAKNRQKDDDKADLAVTNDDKSVSSKTDEPVYDKFGYDQ